MSVISPYLFSPGGNPNDVFDLRDVVCWNIDGSNPSLAQVRIAQGFGASDGDYDLNGGATTIISTALAPFEAAMQVINP